MTMLARVVVFSQRARTLQNVYRGVIDDEAQHPEELMNEVYVACIFDDCDEPAVYALTARWPDGHVWKRNVCLVHTPRGIDSLKHFREPEDGEPIVTQVALV